MIRATTPTHSFNIPIDSAMIKEILLTYRQNGKNIIEKRLEDFEVNGNTYSVTLTQKETKMFTADTNVEIQMRVLTTEGNALASKTFSVKVDKVLNDEVME